MSIELNFDKDKGKYFIRNGLFRTNCVIDNIKEVDLLSLYRKIGRVLKIPDWKKEMEKDKRKYLCVKR